MVQLHHLENLTDTWAVNYEDYPSSETFGANDGNTTLEIIQDDIYVGYRYFDTFNITPAYEFGMVYHIQISI